MPTGIKSNWVMLLAGALMVIFGIFALANPTATFLTLAVLLGIVSIIGGLMLIYTYYKNREVMTFSLRANLVLGVILLIVGIVFLARPDFAAKVFAFVIAVWFIFAAVLNLKRVKLLREFGQGLYGFNIVLNILLLLGGILLLINPLIVGVSIALLLGLSLLLCGVAYLIAAFFSGQPQA